LLVALISFRRLWHYIASFVSRRTRCWLLLAVIEDLIDVCSAPVLLKFPLTLISVVPVGLVTLRKIVMNSVFILRPPFAGTNDITNGKMIKILTFLAWAHLHFSVGKHAQVRISLNTMRSFDRWQLKCRHALSLHAMGNKCCMSSDLDTLVHFGCLTYKVHLVLIEINKTES